MKFFIPEWDDHVNKNYDFINDKPINETGKDFKYIWHFFGWDKVPIDGILVSRAQLERSPNKIKSVRRLGFYKYLDVPQNIETISDCGAFDYINEPKPRYEPKNTMDFYKDIGTTVGVTIDHIISKQNQDDTKYRYDITLENAKKMFDLWENKDNYYDSFRLMGAIQGWDTLSYRKAAQDLIEYGFRYIGIGGVARAHTNFIKDIVLDITSFVKKFEIKNKEKVDIHIFGFAKAELFDTIAKAGITSFDSASPLRKAWLSHRDNYFSTYNKRYSAIRVRITKEGNIIQKNLEQEVLRKIRAYDLGLLDLKEVCNDLKEYEELTGEITYLNKYVETLKERPWIKCDCPICRDLQIEVCIFRGNNRNRRRGFHNTYIFYNHFKKKIPKILVFTTCTMTKDSAQYNIPAYSRYIKSNNFKIWWNNVHDLPVVDLKILSAKFGLIPWWQKIPDYNLEMKDVDIDEAVENLSKKLGRYDKIFFHGLGLYRKVVERTKEETDFDIEIFPKIGLTNRGKLDIIELVKQPKYLREEILNYLKNNINEFDLNSLKQSELTNFI